MVQRGTQILAIYTGVADEFNHAGQFWEMFPGLWGDSRIAVVYWPGAHHTFPRLADQRRLGDTLLEWATRRWPPPSKLDVQAEASEARARTTLSPGA